MTDIRIEDLTSDQIVTSKRRIGRLVELRRVIRDEVPKVLNGHKFNMKNWIVSAETDSAYVGGIGEEFEPIKCHTAACACGWGGLLSERLKKAGLKWDSRLARLNVKGRSITDDGIAEFFGVCRSVAIYLFYPMDNLDCIYDTQGFIENYVTFNPYSSVVGEEARLEFLSRVDMILNKVGVGNE